MVFLFPSEPKYTKPELLCLYHLATLARSFKRGVQRLELLAPYIVQTFAGLRAESFVRAKQRPLSILFNTTHKQIRDPQAIEKITRTLFFFTMVFPQLQEVENVGMPWLQIHRERSFPFTTSLVNISGCLVEDAEHRQKAIAVSVCAPDVGATCSDAGHSDADAARTLGDLRALLQRVVDAFDAIAFHL